MIHCWCRNRQLIGLHQERHAVRVSSILHDIALRFCRCSNSFRRSRGRAIDWSCMVSCQIQPSFTSARRTFAIQIYDLPIRITQSTIVQICCRCAPFSNLLCVELDWRYRLWFYQLWQSKDSFLRMSSGCLLRGRFLGRLQVRPDACESCYLSEADHSC